MCALSAAAIDANSSTTAKIWLMARSGRKGADIGYFMSAARRQAGALETIPLTAGQVIAPGVDAAKFSSGLNSPLVVATTGDVTAFGDLTEAIFRGKYTLAYTFADEGQQRYLNIDSAPTRENASRFLTCFREVSSRSR
jgi:hypothetical protein